MSTQPQQQPDHEALVADLARAGRAAQRALARMDDAARAAALRSAGAALRAASAQVLEANAGDLAAGETNGLSPAMLGDSIRPEFGRFPPDANLFLRDGATHRDSLSTRPKG